MPTVESVIEQFEMLPEEDQERVQKEISRRRFSAFLKKIADGPETPIPVSDDELNEIVHEARAEMLRARGL